MAVRGLEGAPAAVETVGGSEVVLLVAVMEENMAEVMETALMAVRMAAARMVAVGTAMANWVEAEMEVGALVALKEAAVDAKEGREVEERGPVMEEAIEAMGTLAPEYRERKSHTRPSC